VSTLEGEMKKMKDQVEKKRNNILEGISSGLQ